MGQDSSSQVEGSGKVRGDAPSQIPPVITLPSGSRFLYTMYWIFSFFQSHSYFPMLEALQETFTLQIQWWYLQALKSLQVCQGTARRGFE